jgi:hypothetical protein
VDFHAFVVARQPRRQRLATSQTYMWAAQLTTAVENARNLTTKETIPLTIRHYLKHMSKLTDQFFDAPERYRDKTRQRIYLKDIDCPQVWQDKLKDHIPPGLFYLNESTGEVGGPGASDEAGGRKSRGIGRAGDLMSSLPPELRAENLMCYIGHEGTYTPSHREMCASLGQNIMVDASGQISQDGKPERPGSSIWFMTETKDRHVVSEYWLSVLGHDIEVENHFAQLIAWKKAPFKTYVVEQRPGDFILIPPLAPHQVWNRGTRTMKIAWNRTTAETLELAINDALPSSRVVCRDEQYKNKAIVYYTLLKYSSLIKSARAQVEMGGENAEAIQRSVKVRQIQKDFKKLFDLYKGILLSEMFAPDSREHAEFLPYDSNVTCAYCRCNIFNRFLSCKSCKNLFSSDIEEPYDVCMDCYCMGRSCGCQSGYTWTEQWKWKDLIHKYEDWRAQIIGIDGCMTDKTPLPLEEERRYLGKKTVAQVCQEQLRLRPFVDIKNPQPESNSDDDEPVVDEYGIVKKVSNKKSKQWLSKHKTCHFCLHKHPKWKMAFCSNCDLAYCYGTLFRAHDMMPLSIMENRNWKCPHCVRVCNTGACRRDPRQTPYEPKGTLLGHDTKKVADIRSVECLVDFGVSNLNWMREEEGSNQNAMQRRLHQAEMDKLADPSLDPRYIDDEHAYEREGIAYSPVGDVNGDPNDNGDGHQRDTHDRAESYYADPDVNGEIPRLAQKRGRDDVDEETNKYGKKKAKKPKKNGDPAQSLQPKNLPGKQYQKEVQRKLLEEAKREDRFLLVAARMKNKSKIVKLSISTGLLQRIRERPVPERSQVVCRSTPEDLEGPGDTGSILQSDILTKANAPKEKEKAAKTFRYRVEEDEAYNTRKKKPDVGGAAKPSRSGGRPRFEEMTLDSDEEFGDDIDDVEYTGRAHGRASNWLTRKNQGEKDLPTELPPDFRDGLVRPGRERDLERRRELHERRRTLPPKPKVRLSVGRPPRNRSQYRASNSSNDDGVNDEDDVHVEDNVRNEDDVHDENGIHEEENQSSEVLLLAQQATAAALEAQKLNEATRLETARIEAAEAEVQENLRTKMALFDGSSDQGATLIDDFLGDLSPDEQEQEQEQEQPTHESPAQPSPSPSLSSSSSPVPDPPLRTGPPQTTNSILAKSGMRGKKIKIVSAQSKRNGDNATKTTTRSTTTLTAPPMSSGFTPVNRRPKAIDLSDSDSDDDVPASAPVPVAKRPVGRPPMVPSRGGGAVKRGRGRPRKTM